MIPIDLSGKVALVTGSSKGIGRRTAELLSQAGASVVVNSRSAAESDAVAASLPSPAISIPADVANPEGARRLIDGSIERFGRIDILVNNAATFRENRFDASDYQAWQDGWRRTTELNVYGPANLIFLSLPHMRRQGGGKVINISSRAAFRGETEFADYGATKAALVNLTKSVARACAVDNIISTCVTPGFIETEMAASELEKHRAEIEAQIPLGRVGTADDVAGVVLFLASPFADYLTGITIDVNGGSYLR